jgi:hypothetical protein
VNEPEVGDVVFYMYLGKVSEVKYGNCAYMKYYLGRGELYPTEADCLYGEKKREIRERYEAMGDGFVDGGKNAFAMYSHWSKRIYWSAEIKEVCDNVLQIPGVVYFRTIMRGQAAIDTIDREYGEGAFERYVLEVEG